MKQVGSLVSDSADKKQALMRNFEFETRVDASEDLAAIKFFISKLKETPPLLLARSGAQPRTHGS